MGQPAKSLHPHLKTRHRPLDDQRVPKMRSLFSAAFSFSLFLLLGSAQGVNFTCYSTSTATCQGLVSYLAVNSTTYAAIQSLFQVTSLSSLLGANGLPLSTSADRTVPSRSTVRIPFPCKCSNGTGKSDKVPVYTVKPGDILDTIARNKFEQFVTYQEIAAVNDIPDPNKIDVGQKVWIPLPCSCDPVGGEARVHLGYVVASGDSVAGIAKEFGLADETLLKINGIADPTKLLAGAILDVPLRVCSSSISNTSADYGLTLPNGSYALTADDCILCSCSSSSYQLNCSLNQAKNSSICNAPKCRGNLSLGDTSTSGCEVTTCAYTGYTNTTGLNILSMAVTNQTKCSNGGLRASGLIESIWRISFIFIHMILIWVCFV
ncbi:chitin elicitor-binding protein [Typha angustifolia]|uniref:chitin elicitor-binding protein n=1 Tax=Typha angustifolia TaxID=59011 RepID=UPI003C2D1408